MPPSTPKTESAFSFGNYLQFLSDMLGGDIFPLQREQSDPGKQICERSIDYNLNRKVVSEVQKYNLVFQLQDPLEPYPTLDALGAIRAHLLDHKGDIHQISLIDRMGELTVSFFNLKTIHLKEDECKTPHPRSIVRSIFRQKK